MKIELRAQSYKAIIEALEAMCPEPRNNKEYNSQRRFRLALKEIKRYGKTRIKNQRADS
ncbi:MAG: hypothetical protein SPG69_07860 [Bacteroides pyogenes]|uniref:hypothetical protein n=1 Tax=Bacteroides pyogenes TaxID=310300 RepID=UPI002A909E7C|nr:hypothetical protein [Bacteroides pyogenes]MDY5353925.1 hypothetical protein [Bacteroides pyogenes]